MSVKYFNQNDYDYVPYPSDSLPYATVKSGGCGVTSMAMIISSMTDSIVNPEAMAAYAINCGARVNGGTDATVLAENICQDYGLTYETTSDEDKLLSHLSKGYMAIGNVGGDRANWVGVFSSAGHFIVVAGAIGQTVMVLDPGYYAGKFNLTGRTGKVSVDEEGYCYCDISVLAMDTANRNPSYWLFSKIDNKEEVEMRYNRLSDVPEGYRPTVETLMNAGIIVGDGSDATGNNDVIDLSHDQVKLLIYTYRGGGFDAKLKAVGIAPSVG